MRCLMQLARRTESGPMSIHDIAERESLDKNYTTQILLRLRSAGIVRSVRGKEGGYLLARPPEQIRISEVVRALDPSLFQDLCDKYAAGPPSCIHLGNCGVRPVWRLLLMRITEFLDGVTLADVLRQEEEMASALKARFAASAS